MLEKALLVLLSFSVLRIYFSVPFSRWRFINNKSITKRTDWRGILKNFQTFQTDVTMAVIQLANFHIYICQQFSYFFEVNKIVNLIQYSNSNVGNKSSYRQSCHPINDRTIISESISSQTHATHTTLVRATICVQQSIVVISNTDEAINNSLGCKMTVSKHIATLEFESI